MIRPVTTTDDGRAVYGATIRGVAVLGAGAGLILTSLILGVVALVGLGQQAEKRILLACHESNVRHHDAIPFVLTLAKTSPQPGLTAEQLRAQAEAINAIKAREAHRKLPSLSLEARFFLARIDDFVEVIAPRYNCTARVKRFTR